MSECDDEVPLVAPHDQRASVSQSQWSVTRKPLPAGMVLKYEELRGSPTRDKLSCFEMEERKEDDELLAPKSFDQEPGWHKWYYRSLAPRLRKLRSTSDAWYKKNLSPAVCKLEPSWSKCHRKYVAPTLHRLEPIWFQCHLKYWAPTLRKLRLWWNKGYSKYLAPKSRKPEMVLLMWYI